MAEGDATTSPAVGPLVSSPHAQQAVEFAAELADGVAHDFNNLLTIIMANLAFVADTAGIPSDCRQAAQTALGATQRGARLTERLGAFSRARDLRPEVVDMAELLAESAGDWRRVFGSVLEIEVAAHGDDLQVIADPGELRNALDQLVVNAREAVPDTGGKLTVSAASSLSARRSPIADARTAGCEYVRLTLADDGRGMSQEAVARAFEPFFSTKDARTGHGLGLSIALCFVKQSGGDIEMRSTVGKGTTVELYLPQPNPRKRESGAG